MANHLSGMIPVLLRVALALLFPLITRAAEVRAPIGAHGVVGVAGEGKLVNRLEITQPGIYENFIVDGQGASGNLVKVTADNVTIRHCEIRNGSGNGIGIFGRGVVIERCRIHHMLNGTFGEQADAHGISGRWGDTIIRHCDIGFTSGDSIQFDPDRRSSGSAVVEHCTLWTGPLAADAAGFKVGERPGENAIDTKTKPDGPRCKLVVRYCHFHGWNQPALIANAAALNLKENVDAEVSQCVFTDNEIALRVRGPGERGGARVVIRDCAIEGAVTGVRAEDRIEQLHIDRLAFGRDVRRRIHFVGGKPSDGFRITGKSDASDIGQLLRGGFPAR